MTALAPRGLRLLTGLDLPPLAWQHATAYDPARFMPVRHGDHMPVKPYGGLWTAPLHPDGGTHWTDWCRHENFGNPDAPLTIIEPDPGAVVYLIDTVEDLLALEARYPGPRMPGVAMWPGLDWEAVACDIDAVWLTDEGQWRTRFSHPGLYGWDCATVLWLQPRYTVKEGQ